MKYSVAAALGQLKEVLENIIEEIAKCTYCLTRRSQKISDLDIVLCLTAMTISEADTKVGLKLATALF